MSRAGSGGRIHSAIQTTTPSTTSPRAATRASFLHRGRWVRAGGGAAQAGPCGAAGVADGGGSRQPGGLGPGPVLMVPTARGGGVKPRELYRFVRRSGLCPNGLTNAGGTIFLAGSFDLRERRLHPLQ